MNRQNKTVMMQNWFVKQLMEARFKGGDKLPGARDLCSEVDASFAVVQHAIGELVKIKILKTIPRQGTFVDENWRERVPQTVLTAFKPEEELFWLKGLRDIYADAIPDLQICTEFDNSVFEIRTTSYVQSNYKDYLDLGEIFDECYPDKSDFFMQAFKSFYINGRLSGIPFIFSPRVMFYNTELLEKANCATPASGWTWENFIESVEKLKECLDSDRIFMWHEGSYLWMNFVFRAGGSLIVKDYEDPVRIDSPNTRKALRLFTDLRNSLGIKTPFDTKAYIKDFLDGKAAFIVEPREFLPQILKSKLKNWSAVPLPLIPGGRDVTVQATDLLCVREHCAHPELAKRFIKVMLSKRVQDYIASEKYGIPIRKSSAMKSIDLEDPRDALFLGEALKTTGEYNIDSPELLALIKMGIHQIWHSNKSIDEITENLAFSVRTLMQIKKRSLSHKKMDGSYLDEYMDLVS